MLLKKIDALLVSNPWTNVYGLARTLLAFGTFITLLANHSSILFSPVGENALNGDWKMSFGFFSVFGQHLEVARFLAMALLLLVMSGWRPRITGMIHCYISYSFFSTCPIIDGGDHINSLLTFLVLPICLTDSRKWHWDPPRHLKSTSSLGQSVVLFVWGMFLIIRLQASFIYLQAGEAKMHVTDWINGTAFYYWATNHYHGVADWLKPLALSFLSSPFIVMGITWGVILFELMLAAALVMPPRSYKRKLLLVTGMFFHFGIVLVHGLVSFFFVMAAVLVIYLRPANKHFSFQFVNSLSFFTRLIPTRNIVKPTALKNC